MKLYDLAKRVANFVWKNGDWFDEIRDLYDSLDELISETLIGLSDKVYCRAIIDWLNECESEPEEAKRLAKEVKAFSH